MDVISTRNTKGKYQKLDDKKLTGSHYTPGLLASFVAQRIIKNANLESKKNCSIFDPALGDGELLFALASELFKAGVEKINISGFDIDPNAIEIANSRLSQFGDAVNINLQIKDFTRQVLVDGKNDVRFDFVIANPPYVRTQSLGSNESAKLSNEFSLDGRIDLYYVFLLGITKYMHAETIAGYIVSNRFMTTKSGALVRAKLVNEFGLKEIFDLGDTRLFSAAVLPAVLIFSNKKNDKKPGFSSIYSSTENGIGAKEVHGVLDALGDKAGLFKVSEGKIYDVKQGVLAPVANPTDVWRIANDESDGWLNQVALNTEMTFSQIGKIKVGVKTTADKVFIRKTWDDLDKSKTPEPEILRPLMTHHFARRFKVAEGNARKILYPYDLNSPQKKLLDIKKYPKALNYLKSHRQQLEGREYLMEAGREWFELWVPQDPFIWKLPKIVFRDISERPTFWLDNSGSVVNGDCYWFTSESGDQDLLWIALAVANSTFIEAFYDNKFNNKLYAGRRRFMTQYVSQFPIPKLNIEMKDRIVKLTQKIYKALPGNIKDMEEELDRLIWEAFGLNR